MEPHITYAHTLPDTPVDQWEPLEEHLDEVAALCRTHASAFNADNWGFIAGQCHDLGKTSAEFQAYLRSSNQDAENAGEESSSGKLKQASAANRFVHGIVATDIFANNFQSTARIKNPRGMNSAGARALARQRHHRQAQAGRSVGHQGYLGGF